MTPKSGPGYGALDPPAHLAATGAILKSGRLTGEGRPLTDNRADLPVAQFG